MKNQMTSQAKKKNRTRPQMLAGAVAFVSSVSLRVFLAEVPSRLELLSPTRRLETKTSRFTLGINSSQNIRRSVQYLSYIDNDSRTSARFFLTIFIRVLHRTDLSTENTSALYPSTRPLPFLLSHPS